MFFSLNADMEAALYFSQSWYSIAESSELLQVCVGLSVRPESDVVVTVTSNDITARGETAAPLQGKGTVFLIIL